MPSLVDIAKSIATCDVRGVKIEVPGVSAQGLVYLFLRFDELRKFFGGRAQDITPEKLMAQSPDILGAFIAAGVGKHGDVEEEQAAKTLSAGDALPLILKIWEVTFPRGYKDFLEALERVAALVPVASGWDQDTKLAGHSNGSSSSATRQPSPGDTPQESSTDGSSSTSETDLPTKPSSSPS
jgi:hypothetical protein